MKKILIQLIGGQLLPNIFSMLSLKPDEVHNIYTPRTEVEARRLETWVKKHADRHLLDSKVIGHCVTKQTEETDKRVTELIDEFRQKEDCIVCLNMTGGTKLMVVAAVDACKRQEETHGIKIPIFYVDTDERNFEFISHSDERSNLLTEKPFSDKLSVEEIIAAGRTKIVGKPRDWRRAYPAAKAVMELAPNIKLIESFKFTPKNVGKLASSQPVSAWTPSKKRIRALARYAEQRPAVKAAFEYLGFIIRQDDFHIEPSLVQTFKKETKLVNDYGRVKKLAGPLQAAQNFFFGGWWEVCVAQYMEHARKYTQILWSVETALDDPKHQNEDRGTTESDIIASDGIRLTCVSCKRGTREKEMVTELEQHFVRSVTQGGIKGVHSVAIYNKGKKPVEDRTRDIQATAKLCRLSILWGNDVVPTLSGQGVGVVGDKVATTIDDNGATSSPAPASLSQGFSNPPTQLAPPETTPQQSAPNSREDLPPTASSLP